jgi:hypothetical protein
VTAFGGGLCWLEAAAVVSGWLLAFLRFHQLASSAVCGACVGRVGSVDGCVMCGAASVVRHMPRVAEISWASPGSQ